MNLNPECPTPVDEQLLTTFTYSINWRDSHDIDARRFATYAANGGQTCDCEDPEYGEDDDTDHQCLENPLNVEGCLAQAQIFAGLAQSAATAALAAATMRSGTPTRLRATS